jgi:putative oxidoreductase
MTSDFGRVTHAILRIAVALLFMQHGLQKLFGILGGMGTSGATAPLMSLMGAAGLLEFAGGILLALGLLTRPVAAVLLLEMVYAFVTVHAPQGGAPIQNQGELALLYGSIFLFLMGAGAGPFSIDAWMPAHRAHDRRHGLDRREHATA